MGDLSDTSKLLGEIAGLGVELQGVDALLRAVDVRMATIRQLLMSIIDKENIAAKVDEGP